MTRRRSELGASCTRRRRCDRLGAGRGSGRLVSLETVSRRTAGSNSQRWPGHCHRRLASSHKPLVTVTSRHVTDRELFRCKYCMHKARHESVAARHVWRVHGTGSGSSCDVSVDRPYLTSEQDMSLPCDETQYQSGGSGRPSMNESDNCVVTEVRGLETSNDVAGKDAQSTCAIDVNIVNTSWAGHQASAYLQSCLSRRNGSVTSPGDRGAELAEMDCLTSDLSYRHAARASTLVSLPSSCPISTLLTSGWKLATTSDVHKGKCAVNQTLIRPVFTYNPWVEKYAQSSNCPLSAAAADSAKRFECPLCWLTYKRVADLNRHMKQKHWTSLKHFYESGADMPRVDRPLNLTQAKTSQSAVIHDHHQTSQDRPLDLSLSAEMTSNSDDCTSALSSSALDMLTEFWRSFSNQLIPPFDFGDYTQKAKSVDQARNSTGALDAARAYNFNSSCNRPSVTSLSATPMMHSFCETSTKSTPTSVLSSWYFDARTSATGAVHGDNTLSRRRLEALNVEAQTTSTDSCLRQPMNMQPQCLLNGSTRSLSAVVDGNNNDFDRCDLTGSQNISTDGSVDAVPCSLQTARVNAVPREADGRCPEAADGLWGQCPLCSFVCPHPLVMRRHLDVHDEPALQRSSHLRHPVDSLQRPSASNRQSTMLSAGESRSHYRTDSTSAAGSARDRGAASMMTALNCPFTPTSRGVTDWTMETRTTPSWLSVWPQSLSSTSDLSGKFPDWNTTSGSTEKSAGVFRASAGGATVPCHASTRCGGSWRAPGVNNVLTCSQSSLRSSNDNEAKKYIADQQHAVSRSTWPVMAGDLWSSACPPRPPSAATYSKDTRPWWQQWMPGQTCKFPVPESAATVSDPSATAPAASILSTRRTHLSATSQRHVPDFKKLKRFCCTSCPYRSNFRSDVVRHVRHKHPTVDCAAGGVSKLDAACAAATLPDYIQTWAKKKFVLHSRRRRRRRSRDTGPPAMTTGAGTVTCSVAGPQQGHSDTGVQLACSSGCQLRAGSAASGSSESQTTSDGQLVIDTGMS